MVSLFLQVRWWKWIKEKKEKMWSGRQWGNKTLQKRFMWKRSLKRRHWGPAKEAEWGAETIENKQSLLHLKTTSNCIFTHTNKNRNHWVDRHACIKCTCGHASFLDELDVIHQFTAHLWFNWLNHSIAAVNSWYLLIGYFSLMVMCLTWNGLLLCGMKSVFKWPEHLTEDQWRCLDRVILYW